MTLNSASARGREVLHSFTLVELLVVIAIGSILVVLSVDAYTRIIRSTTVSTGAQMLTGALDLARQTAASQNGDIEFRLYQLPDARAATTAAPTVYRAFQTFLVGDGATNAITKVSFLPSPTVISSTQAQTSLIGLGVQNGSAFTQGSLSSNTPQLIPVYGSNYKAIAFRFSPDGGIEQPAANSPAQWFLTLVLENDPANGGAGQPNNFATIQLDLFTGRAKVFRP
jgi:uncharacterized protein (TIGR02596 family)